MIKLIYDSQVVNEFDEHIMAKIKELEVIS